MNTRGRSRRLYSLAQISQDKTLYRVAKGEKNCGESTPRPDFEGQDVRPFGSRKRVINRGEKR